MALTVKFQQSALPDGVTAPAPVSIIAGSLPHVGDRIHMAASAVPDADTIAALVASNHLPASTDSLGEPWRHVQVNSIVHDFSGNNQDPTVWVAWPVDVPEAAA
jgi:hypothetical protein